MRIIQVEERRQLVQGLPGGSLWEAPRHTRRRSRGQSERSAAQSRAGLLSYRILEFRFAVRQENHSWGDFLNPNQTANKSVDRHLTPSQAHDSLFSADALFHDHSTSPRRRDTDDSSIPCGNEPSRPFFAQYDLSTPPGSRSSDPESAVADQRRLPPRPSVGIGSSSARRSHSAFFAY